MSDIDGSHPASPSGAPGAKWQGLHRSLRREIITGRRPAGSVIPGQNHLAASYKVSVNTVREAVAALVHEGLLVRARGKKTLVSNTIAPGRLTMSVFTAYNPEAPNFNSRATVEILGGVSRAIRDLGLTMQLHRVEVSGQTFVPRDIGGLMDLSQGALIVQGADSVVLPVCRQNRLPYVLVDAQSDRSPLPQVTYDRRQAARIAAEHICRLGHTRIALIGSCHDVVTEMQRKLGFLDVVAAHGLDLPAGCFVQCEKSVSVLREATRGLLRCRQRPTCICCTTDRIASAALTVLHEEGLACPRDMAVISFTDSPESAEEGVAITGVHQPFEEVGYEATKLLRRIISGQGSVDMPVVVPTRLVVRQSCGGQPAQAARLTSPTPAPADTL